MTTEQAPQRICDWLEIAPDGTITAYTGKVEVGQNVRTSLAQAVADELRVPLDAVRLVMADTGRVPFDPGTFGSRSTPGMAPLMRRAAAAAREALVDLAAERWEASRADLLVGAGKITHPETGQALSFAELAGGRPLTQTIGEDVPLTPVEQWSAAGRSTRKVNARAMVTGEHHFTSDLVVPGMVHGRVVRPTAFGATLRSIEASAAEAIPGVQVVRDGDFIGVVAPDRPTAFRAAAAVQATWDPPAEPPPPSSRDVWEYFRQNPAEPQAEQRFGGGEVIATGSVAEGLRAAEHTLAVTYTAAYIAHAPLETRAAVAQWEGDSLTVWTGTQRPFGVQRQLMDVLDLSDSQVRVIVPDTGSGYGGKHYGDAALEAARLARATGKPVKVVWTREEEFTWAYFRPAALIDVRAGVAADGRLTAWEHLTFNAGAAGIRSPYGVPHQRIEFQVTKTPVRQGSYRALAATANHFARESAMDELAHALGMDPLEIRRKNLVNDRVRAVLEAAAEHFGWNARPTRHMTSGVATGQGRKRGIGLSCGTEKGGYVATCAEVEVEQDAGGAITDIRVLRVVEAFECGAVVNPDHLRNQIEGAVVQGLGGALWEAIEFAGGAILNPWFSQYRVPRIGDTPVIETLLVDRKDLPSAGAGETPIIGIAPAVANAVFDATGIRLRDMPLLKPRSAA